MHPIVTALGMTRNRFIFLWRHFHVSEATKEDLQDSFENDLNDNEEGLVEENMERIQVNQESEVQEDEQEESEKEEKETKVWFPKLEPLVNHV